MIGVTRGIATLVGAGIAGILLWFATQVGTESTGAYWATYGLVAAAGLTMALSQIVGGWTKWGWPRFSFGVLLLGFLPVLLVGGWILLARQPADFMNTSNWSRELGIHGLVADLGNILPAIAFGIGLVFGYTVDTAGRRTEVVERDHVYTDDRDVHEDRIYTHEGHVHDDDRTAVRDADEPLSADRGPYAPPPTVPVGTADTDDHGTVTGTTARERRVEH